VNATIDKNTHYPHNTGEQPTRDSQTNTNKTSTRTNNQQTASTSNKGAQPESTRIEVNELEVEEILATLEVATKNKQTEHKLNAYAPLDKHTNAEMPQIYTDSPAGLLEGLDRDQAHKWLRQQTLGMGYP
jgi:hypothetical protein